MPAALTQLLPEPGRYVNELRPCGVLPSVQKLNVMRDEVLYVFRSLHRLRRRLSTASPRHTAYRPERLPPVSGAVSMWIVRCRRINSRCSTCWRFGTRLYVKCEVAVSTYTNPVCDFSDRNGTGLDSFKLASMCFQSAGGCGGLPAPIGFCSS